MTAQEMFEELGYTQNDNEISYENRVWIRNRLF